MELVIKSIENQTITIGNERGSSIERLSGLWEVACIVTLPDGSQASLECALRIPGIADLTMKEITEYVKEQFYTKAPDN